MMNSKFFQKQMSHENLPRSILMKQSTELVNEQIKEDGTFSKKTMLRVKVAYLNQIKEEEKKAQDLDLIEDVEDEEEDDESLDFSSLNESDMSNMGKESSARNNAGKDGLDQEKLKRQNSIKKRKKSHYYLINLDGKFKFFWDNFQLVLLFYVATFAIYKISFVEDEEYPLWDNIDFLVDVLFFFDILLNFFTPYYDKVNCEIVYSHKRIACRYLKAVFWMDLLSIFPFDYVIASDKSDYSILLRVSKIPKLAKIMRTTKIIRTFKVGKKDTVLRRIVRILTESNYIFKKVIPLMSITLILGHIFACVWHFTAAADETYESWIARYNYTGENSMDRYAASFYFAFTTMTTTGYGDITPGTRTEFVLTLLFMFVGVIIHSLVFGSIFDAIENNKKEYDKFNTKLNMIRNLKKVGLIDKEEIYRHILSLIYEKKAKKLETIPEFKNVKEEDVDELKIEVLKNKYKFGKNIFFQSFRSERVWITFYNHMQRKTYRAGDVIYQEGDPSQHFFVIVKGKVFFLLSREKSNDIKRYWRSLDNRHKSVFVGSSESKKSKEELKNKRKSFMPSKEIVPKKVEENSSRSEKEEDDILRNFEFFRPKSYFGEFELFDKKFENKEQCSTRKFTVVAASKCVFYTVPTKVFLEVMENSGDQPVFMNHLYDRFENVKQAETEMVEMIKKQLKQNKRERNRARSKNQVVPMSSVNHTVFVEDEREEPKPKIKISKFNDNRKISAGKTKSRTSSEKGSLGSEDFDQYSNKDIKSLKKKSQRIKEYSGERHQRSGGVVAEWIKGTTIGKKISGERKSSEKEGDRVFGEFGLESKRSLNSNEK